MTALPITDKQIRAASLVVEYPGITDAADLIIKEQKCSTSFIQRHLSIGYNRAARIVEALEEFGVVTASNEVGKRTVLVKVVPRELELAALAQKVDSPLTGGGSIPMKETPEDKAVTDKAYRVSARELRQFAERYERLESEKKDIADQQKEVMAEAKGRGYDTKVLRKVGSLRKREPDDIAEEQAVLEMYTSALGM
jgi:uncharacterized protein (UPF0335 family)